MQIKADVQSALICINLRFSFYINELFYGKTMIKYLVVGLGNIGPEYHETRHNIGFMTVEALARINNAPPFMDGRTVSQSPKAAYPPYCLPGQSRKRSC